MDGRQQAPELPEGLSWVNTRQPLKLADLRGRVVILFVWTYSNINAVHALGDLRYLENKYHDGLTVVSLHTPKFTSERQAPHVLKAVNRLHVRHPVASDPDFLGWQVYGIRAWPSYVVIDTEGCVAATLSGEGRRGELDALVGQLLDEAASRDTRVYESVQPVARPEPRVPLRFPGHVLATENALYVADSGHNRVLEVSFEGRIVRQFGSGNVGFWDGRGTDSGFNEPQGLALLKDMLFVADHGNHAIRRIRLLSGDVDTVAGTGAQGSVTGLDLPEPHTVALNSPWGLAASGERVYIAMAGAHQVWMLDLARQRIGVFAGSGRHALEDGALVDAAFAKPLGLAVQGQMLYVADADASAVRAIKFLDGQVRTIAGAGLYEFGDASGDAPAQIRLQHPTAVAVEAGGGAVWVADAFNDRIKLLSTRGGGIRSVEIGHRLHEPGGLSLHGEGLWIANTNAHEIIRVDTATGEVRRIPIGE